MPAETQQDFVDAVFDASRPVIDGARDPSGAHAPKRFNVYRNNVVVSLIEALGEGFPLVKRLVGEDFFAGMAKEYVLANPPSSPLMFLYGDKFPEFIQGYPPVQSVPYLSDMARLEYAQRLAYFAADARYLDRETLAGIDEEAFVQLRFELHPSVRVVASKYPIFDIFEKLNGRADVTRGAQEALIYRVGYEVKTVLAPNGVGKFFSEMAENGVGAAAETVLEDDNGADIPTMVSLAIEMSVRYE